MNRIWKKEFSDTLWFLGACFVLGMTGGVLLANLVYPYHSSEAESMVIYFMQQLKEADVSFKNYFLYLLKFRGQRILIMMLAGMTSIAHWLAVAASLLLGIYFGVIGSIVLLQFGLQGFLLLMVAVLPQILVYIPTTWILLAVIYHMKGNIWKKTPETIKEYFVWMGMCILGYLLGLLLESYVNMPLLKLFIKKYAFL